MTNPHEDVDWKKEFEKLLSSYCCFRLEAKQKENELKQEIETTRSESIYAKQQAIFLESNNHRLELKIAEADKQIANLKENLRISNVAIQNKEQCLWDMCAQIDDLKKKLEIEYRTAIQNFDFKTIPSPSPMTTNKVKELLNTESTNGWELCCIDEEGFTFNKKNQEV